MSQIEANSKRHDNYAVLALGLAIVLTFIEGDMFAIFGAMGRVDMMAVSSGLYYVAVLTPWMISMRRHWREPRSWNGRGYLIASAIILVLNSVIRTYAFVEMHAQLAA